MKPLQFADIVDVRGIKVRAKVYSKKNTTMLFHYGNIIKNVSVGSYVKIVKGFTEIVGVVEGEYINEKISNGNDFISSEDKFDRVIEIKILGIITGDGFKRGISEMPLLYNPVFILAPLEFEMIFNQSSGGAPNNGLINLGSLINDESIKITVDINGILNGHIGIFGNTGSGKSNTLAKLYKELFIIAEQSKHFKNKSKFIFIDFNGEYEKKSLSPNKRIISINTNKNHGEDKIPIKEKHLFNIEMLSIILEATEKTQQPFVERCLKFTNKYYPSVFSDETTILNNISQLIYDNQKNLKDLQQYFNEFLKLIAKEEVNDYFSKFRYVNNDKADSLIMNKKDWINTIEELREEIFKDLQNKINPDLQSLEYAMKMKIAFNYKFLEELGKGYISKEHIAPLMKRLDRVFELVNKVFNVESNEEIFESIQVVNLRKANLQAKKVIPLIVCKSEYEKHTRRENIREDKILNIIIDEAHNILSTQSDRESKEWKDYRLEIFEEIIKEGRKFGVFLTISSQRPSDISSTLISQLNHYLIHRLMNQEDLNKILSTVTFLDSNSFNMIPSLPPGGCILTGSSINFPILIQVDKLEEDFRPSSDNIDVVNMWFPKNK
ncbi:MAG: ATP-binding protein [Candidatus Izemoplasma sp.]|nr:ATP-binding protein [Candidatus Izemoplasma sp.]